MDMTMKDYVNWKISHDVKYGKTEGYPLVLKQCRKNKELKDFKIYGNSVQNSENLFDKSKVTSGVYIDDTGVETATTATYGLSDYIEVVSGGTYAVEINSPNSTNNIVRVNYYNSEKIWVSQTLYAISSTGTISKQITIPDEVIYIRISSRDVNTIKVYRTLSPENPIEVQSVGELTKNLFDKDNHKPHSAYINISKNFYGYAEDSTSIVVSCKPNTSYTISHACENLTIFRACTIKDEPPTVLGGTVPAYNVVYSESISEKVLTIVTTEDSKYIVVQCSKSRFDDFIETLQIEEGTTATEYEPYHKYKVPVTVRGKNFINEYRAFNTSSGLRVSAIGNLVTINGSDNANAALVYDSSKAILLKAGKTYTVSRRYVSGECLYSYSNGGFYVGLRKADNSWLANLDSITTTNYKTANRKTFTVTKDTLCSFGCVGNGEYNQLKMTVQLEEASNLTAHEPYIEPQKFNIYLDAPLRKVGDYADCVDFEKGLVERYVYTLKGSDILINGKSGEPAANSFYAAYKYSSKALKCRPNVFLASSATNNVIPLVLCNKLPAITYGTMKSNKNIYGLCVTENAPRSGNEIRVSLPDTIATTTQEAIQWLNDNDCTVYLVYLDEYITEEPVELPKLPKTQAKTMIYEVDTSISPSNMSARYVKKH